MAEAASHICDEVMPLPVTSSSSSPSSCLVFSVGLTVRVMLAPSFVCWKAYRENSATTKVRFPHLVLRILSNCLIES